MIEIEGLPWLVILLGPLLITQRLLNQEIQAVLILLTRRADISIVLYSILFFPGVLLHEGSHWLSARLLGVRTGHISIVPQRMSNGKLRLGYVETAPADVFRDALIGAAPLIAGGLFVAYAGWTHLGAAVLWSSYPQAEWKAIQEILPYAYTQPDFPLWVYLTFAVSATMFPSSSDRRAWLPVSLMVGLLIVGVLLSGAGAWFLEHLAKVLDAAIWSTSFVFGISLVVQVVLLIPFFLIRVAVSRITGLEVVKSARGS